uniref:Cuticle protein 3 n=1 Tax=Lonomia obliqua TaxID=304329 RepID=CU03_LONON|nr:RecName: Full=Cuticle protein 3; Flags: Precursor [Lonomia obliqua]ABU88846.1 cuticle protein 3 [Lonomia obliqua]
MMKLIVLAAFIGVCAGGALPGYVAPQYRFAPDYYPEGRYRPNVEGNAAVLRSDSEVSEQGFRYAYETENGIRGEATGVESDGIQSQGSFAYTGADGQQYSVTYTADGNGFQPQGAHFPTPPPVPEAIVRSLQENARDEAAGIFDDGSYHEAKYDPASIAAKAQHQYHYQPNTRYFPRYHY